MSNKKENVYLSIIAILLFLIGFLYAFDNEAPEFLYNEDIDHSKGGEFLRFVFIGSSTCIFNDSDTHNYVKELKSYFQKYAKHHGYKFISTGISVDMNSLTGIKYLKETGQYDEIIAGGSWYNLGVHHYVWEKFPARASTPQVIITTTNYTIVTADREIGNIKRDESLLKRLAGLNEIKEFYNLVKMLHFDELRFQLEREA